ncbi:hypothetical protein MRX96_049463 [Rhipicephalus microplus]
MRNFSARSVSTSPEPSKSAPCRHVLQDQGSRHKDGNPERPHIDVPEAMVRAIFVGVIDGSIVRGRSRPRERSRFDGLADTIKGPYYKASRAAPREEKKGYVLFDSNQLFRFRFPAIKRRPHLDVPTA